VARSSSVDNAIRLCTSGFVNDVMFSHNGPNTDKCSQCSMQQVIRRDSPGGAAKLRSWGEVCYPRFPCLHFNDNISASVDGDVILVRVHPVHLTSTQLHVASDPHTKPTVGRRPPVVCYRSHPPSPFIIVILSLKADTRFTDPQRMGHCSKNV